MGRLAGCLFLARWVSDVEFVHVNGVWVDVVRFREPFEDEAEQGA